jgi:hypothetical protein
VCDAAKLLKKLEKDRPRVLTASTRALAESIAKDKKKSREFLESTGIVDKRGRLTQHYR